MFSASRIRYEITSGNLNGAFEINNETGTLSVAGSIDYETQKKYELSVSATDSGGGSNYTSVVIHVRDVNDNPPLFERPTYRTQITEEDDRNLPKRVLQVKAIDADVDRPQSVIYFLTGPGIDPDNPNNSKFDINKMTGEIYVLKPLNRDLPPGRPQWRFTVFAQDERGEGLVGYADVQINLKDINDNAPLFPQGVYYGNVTENETAAGLAVMTMTAVDYDDPHEGTNARLVYSIEKNVIEEETGSAIFEIEPDTGQIRTLICCLDRERTPDYSIQIVAMDGGGLKGTGTASIRVKDINDMPPTFTKDEWFTEVEETDGMGNGTLPATPILTVTVHDEDETNVFFYKVVAASGNGADRFKMVRNNDGTGSLKITRPLDYEDSMQRAGFRFRIQVNDRGFDNETDPYHMASSWVVVKLRDINDNDPRFDRPNIQVTVPESAEVGRPIEIFHAIDPDQAGASRVSYAIDRLSDRRRHFTINVNGTILLQRPLDRERQQQHVVRILASDDGHPLRTSTATLTVLVDDINDNAPRLASPEQRPVVLEHVPPRKRIAELRAIDADDASRGNGPPFTWKLAENVEPIIRASFAIEQDNNAYNKEGVGILHSLRSFDREQRKEYAIPVAVSDAGRPSLTATAIVNVIIGDVNDNKMKPGFKEIFVYNYMVRTGQAPDTEIGRVFINDFDDWDLPDKNFYWEGAEHPKFRLNEDTGMITMRHGTWNGRYDLHFRVYDRKQTDVTANVTVTVQEIPYEAVKNSGSMRISGLSARDLVSTWNDKTQSRQQSIIYRLREKLAEVFNTHRDAVDIFSVQPRREQPPLLTDLRFSVRGHGYFNPVRLNGLILMQREEIEKAVGINITMVGIDECLYEGGPDGAKCEGSCTNRLEVINPPRAVDANSTGLVGVRVQVTADCSCGARNFTRPESCRQRPCRNGGRCLEDKYGLRCECPVGYPGPHCQQPSRSFRGNGWAWYSPLTLCDRSHLSLEFVTVKGDGTLLYNGPIVPPEEDERIISDFILLELEKGMPRLLIDFGSGTLEMRVNTKNTLDDGEWHRLDIFWDTETVRLVVDFCQSADVLELDDGSPSEKDLSSCQASGTMPQFNELLNVNAPLQLGGLHVKPFEPALYGWRHSPSGKGFDGCIRNLMHNSQLYDLSHPGLTRNTESGCPQTEQVCANQELALRCWEHGTCVGGMREARCQCNPGWTGSNCFTPTVPTTFRSQSYVKYALSFEPDRFTTHIQLRFRTREAAGELFRVSDQHNREYAILEIKKRHLLFRYNLNNLRPREQSVWLNAITVDDGQWHTVTVSRFGSTAILALDGGEGRRYNESFEFVGHQWLMVDKQEGVYAGGKAEYTGVRTFEVLADFQKGCLDDIRLDGKLLPLPPAMNGTQWGQATMARNLERACNSNAPCINVICPEPFECIDRWYDYDCSCGAGRIMSPNTKDCLDKNECLDHPCLNGGTCINQEPRLRYRCLCADSFYGENCELFQEGQTMQISMGALAAILACLLTILILALVLIGYTRRRHVAAQAAEASAADEKMMKKKKKQPGQTTEEDIRENVISYDDEGGGEDDMTFDINPLKIPIDKCKAGTSISPTPAPITKKSTQPAATVPSTQIPMEVISSLSSVDIVPPTRVIDVARTLDAWRHRADQDQAAPPFDDLRNYAYEGAGSISGSLSSLASEATN